MGITDSFRFRRTDVAEHAVDFDDLAERMRKVPPLERPANEFAPRRAAPPQAVERAIAHIETFTIMGERLQEVDRIMAELDSEYLATKQRHQSIRDCIMRVHADELELIERSRKVTQVQRELFSQMEDKIKAVYQPAATVVEPVQPAAQEQTDGEQTQEPDGTERAA